MALAIGEKGQGISSVARDAALDRLDIFPVPLRCFDLQARHVLGEQQRQTAKVRVPALGVPLGEIPFLLRPHIVDHVPEVVVRVLVVRMRIDEVVFWKLEDDGHEDEELAHDLVPDVAVESCDLYVALAHDLVFAYVGIGRGRFGDVELPSVDTRSAQDMHVDDTRTISTFSFTPVSPIHRAFSRYPKYSPSAKLQGNLRFSSSGSLKKALPMLNWRRTRSSSRPVLTTTQKPTLVSAS